MKVEFELVPTKSLEIFAEENGLTLKIRELSKKGFTASFEDCEIGGDGMLRSEYGDGDTPNEAVDQYSKKISQKLLVFGAYTEKRQEMKVPRLTRRDDYDIMAKAYACKLADKTNQGVE